MMPRDEKSVDRPECCVILTKFEEKPRVEIKPVREKKKTCVYSFWNQAYLSCDFIHDCVTDEFHGLRLSDVALQELWGQSHIEGTYVNFDENEHFSVNFDGSELFLCKF
jgi:hypothetical protein